MPRLTEDQYRLRSLTPREHEVLVLITLGMSNPQIAKKLGCHKKTVTNHITHITHKVGLAGMRNRVLLALWYKSMTTEDKIV